MSTAEDDDDDLLNADDDDDADDVDLEEGIFNERQGIFDDKHTGPFENQNNPVETRAQEQRQMYPKPAVDDADAPVVAPDRRIVATTPGAKDRHQLVAQLDEDGNAVVARFKNGKQVEAFHPPTVQEASTLKSSGRIVNQNAIADVPAPASSGIPWKKVLLWGGGLTVAGLAAWWAYKKYKSDSDADVDEVE